MYFWNIDALTNDLKNKTLDQVTKFKYLLVFMGIWLISSEIAFWLIPIGSSLEIISSFVNVVLSLFGLMIVYRANKAGDNQDFIERFICLSLPVTIRWMIVFFSVFIIQGVVLYAFYGQAGLSAGNFIFEVSASFLTWILILGYYLYLAKCVRKIFKD